MSKPNAVIDIKDGLKRPVSIGGGQRIGEAGQGLALFLVHGEHGDVLADEVAPPLGVGLDDEASTQGQHHRHAGLGNLPGGFGTGEAAADDVNRLGHVSAIGLIGNASNCGFPAR